MRIRLTLKDEKDNDVYIPYNYNYQLASAIYSKIVDIDYLNKLHESQNFKFFTFSSLYIKNVKVTKKGLIARKGEIELEVSSPDKYFITNVLNGFITNPYLKLYRNIFIITNIREINEKYSENETVKTISPIISRTKKKIDNKLKIWDLAPSDHFFKNLEENLIKKYKKFYNLEETNLNISISSEMRSVKEKRIKITKNNNSIYQRCYLMDLNLKGDLELIKFAYETGLGEKNSMGFGMITKA